MKTRRLYKGDDFIIVEAGSGKEKTLLAAGWKEEPEKAAKPKGRAVKAARGKEGGEPCESGDDAGDSGAGLPAAE